MQSKPNPLSDALNPEINSPAHSITINSPRNTPRPSLSGFDSIEILTPNTPSASSSPKNSTLFENISVHAIQNASNTARNALISPLLAENNKEHFAIILANCSKNIKYKALYAIIASMAAISFTALWFKLLPQDSSTTTGSAFNIIAITSGILMLVHSFINQVILWNIDTNFKAQARELIIGFNEGITRQQEANQELDKNIEAINTANNQLSINITELESHNQTLARNITDLNKAKKFFILEISNLKDNLKTLKTENKEFKNNNKHLKNSIHSLDGLIRNTTSEVSKWMDIALKEDENSKQVLKTLKIQLLEASSQAKDGYQVFLGVASNLQGVRRELSDLTNKNKALTKEYKEVLSQIINVQKQLKEQKFLDNLRTLARQVDHFADQGGRDLLNKAIQDASAASLDNITIPASVGVKFNDFLNQLDSVLSDADSFSSINHNQATNYNNINAGVSGAGASGKAAVEAEAESGGHSGQSQVQKHSLTLCDYAERRISEIEEPPTPPPV